MADGLIGLTYHSIALTLLIPGQFFHRYTKALHLDMCWHTLPLPQSHEVRPQGTARRVAGNVTIPRDGTGSGYEAGEGRPMKDAGEDG
ncbi:unnamed protein product [Cutaneotrichosporon oleaginosum]